MSDMSLGYVQHKSRCPHCHEQTLHLWPGNTILFATITCSHCDQKFLIVQNKPWLEFDDRPVPADKRA